MKQLGQGILGLGVASLGSVLVACGPARVQVQPKDVVNVTVRPASGQLLFCPGDPFLVELLARLKDGTTCSSTDRSRGCLTKKDAVIDAASVRIQGSQGGFAGEPARFIWNTDPNPLTTASTGLRLKGWVEVTTGAGTERSMPGEALLRPVYQCRQQDVFAGQWALNEGANGGPGPDLDIAVTTLSTPFYANAALVRVIRGTERMYYISPSPEEPIRIVSRGQDGAPGRPGAGGLNGRQGPDGVSTCAKGGKGDPGSAGGAGSNGGNGGPGGQIRVTLDAEAADKLRGRILAESVGGAGGPGGPGGRGGQGGEGGRGGPAGTSCATGGDKGANGDDGPNGPPGQPGNPGPNGPPPSFATAPRAALFGTELPQIQQIEATRAPSP